MPRTISYLRVRSHTDSRYSVMENVSRNTLQNKIDTLQRYVSANKANASWSPSTDIACQKLMDEFQNIVNTVLTHKTMPPIVVSRFEQTFYTLMQDA